MSGRVVALALRFGLNKSRVLARKGGDALYARPGRQRDVQARGVGHLRHQAAVGQRGCRADAPAVMVGQPGFEGVETLGDPVGVPGVFLRLTQAQLMHQVFQNAQVVQRVDVAGDELGDVQHLAALRAVGGHKQRLGLNAIQMVDDGQRLRQPRRAIDQRRHQPRRVERQKLRAALSAAAQVHGYGFMRQPF